MWQHSLQLKIEVQKDKKSKEIVRCLKSCFYLYKGCNAILNNKKANKKPEENEKSPKSKRKTKKTPKNPNKKPPQKTERKIEKYLNDK